MPQQFLIEFRITRPFNRSVRALIPRQKELINDLMFNGVVLSYIMDLEQTSIWALVEAGSESEALSIVDELPLTPHTHLRIYPARPHRVSVAVPQLPSFSLN